MGFIAAIPAQKVYFVYLQSESNQPFFVNMDDKIFSSSSAGYLILPKLRDSTYKFKIGFTGNKWPEQDFEISMNKKDHGYLIKNFGDQWGLFDLQTLAVNMATSKSGSKTFKTDNSNVSEFTEVLAKAAGDSTLKEKPAELALITDKKMPDKEISNQNALENTVPVSKVTDSNEEKIIKNEVGVDKKEPLTYKASRVTKNLEQSTTEGMDLVFIDEDNGGMKDTIRLFIPETTKVTPLVEKKDSVQIMNNKEMVDEQKPEINNIGSKEIIPTDKTISEKTLFFVKNCKNTADEIDYFILRKRMVSVSSENEKLNEAAEYFKVKCFTTGQLKNLGSLFQNEKGKFRLFEMAYPVVSDKNNFSMLEIEFKDEYFIKKFKSLPRN
jgi:hypothetical protein